MIKSARCWPTGNENMCQESDKKDSSFF